MSDADAYELKVNLPNLPKGEPVQIAGLGTFDNGSTYTVSKEEADSYRSYHSRQVTHYDDETHEVLGSDLEQGPTLLQASKRMHGVEVTTVGKQDDPDPTPDPNTDPDNNDEGGGNS